MLGVLSPLLSPPEEFSPPVPLAPFGGNDWQRTDASDDNRIQCIKAGRIHVVWSRPLRVDMYVCVIPLIQQTHYDEPACVLACVHWRARISARLQRVTGELIHDPLFRTLTSLPESFETVPFHFPHAPLNQATN